ncbi:MAG: hypothetical protein P4L27_11865 [Ignavibacteriaceae bacterium]|nr:hypothetical protein [Ignavibacteriaceae bacterium]
MKGIILLILLFASLNVFSQTQYALQFDGTNNTYRTARITTYSILLIILLIKFSIPQ